MSTMYKKNGISRRDVLASAIALVGGSSLLASCTQEEVDQLDLHSGEFRFFDDRRAALLSRIVDIIVPATDTPGALAAGVDHFVDNMMADWASATTSARLLATLEAIDASATESCGTPFTNCSADEQDTLLRRLDASAFGDKPEVPGFRELRFLVLSGYYSSEIGASVELKFELVPGRYLECVPVEEIGRAWAYR